MNKLKSADISIACYAMVSGRFASYFNPRFNMENTAWAADFPNQMGEHCRVSIMIYVSANSPEERIQISNLASYYGHEIASTLIKRMLE